MIISIIVAADEKNIIGFQGKIPWHLPADFKRFKELTMGHPIIMGWNTFKSIGRALPGRQNIVLAGEAGLEAPGCATARSFEEAFLLAKDSDEVFVIGGGQIYKQAMPKADKIYLTRVHGLFEGDVFFPEIDEKIWRLSDVEKINKDIDNPYDCDFLIYEKR